MRLGDLIEKITTYTGIKWLTKKILGENCGCEERKNKLKQNNNQQEWKKLK
jgi:hypothetical protein